MGPLDYLGRAIHYANGGTPYWEGEYASFLEGLTCNGSPVASEDSLYKTAQEQLKKCNEGRNASCELQTVGWSRNGITRVERYTVWQYPRE